MRSFVKAMILFSFGSTSAISSEASAQMDWIIQSPSSIASSTVFNEVDKEESQRERAREESRRPRPHPLGQKAVLAPAASLLFTPSLQRRATNMSKMASYYDNAEISGQITPKLISFVEQEMVKKGLRANNLADSFAVFLTTAWRTSRGLVGDATTSEMQAASRQLSAMLRANPSVAARTHAEKQLFAEHLLANAVVMSGILESGKGSTQAAASSRYLAIGTAKAVGFDLDRMTLTPKGFVFK